MLIQKRVYGIAEYLTTDALRFGMSLHNWREAFGVLVDWFELPVGGDQRARHVSEIVRRGLLVSLDDSLAVARHVHHSHSVGIVLELRRFGDECAAADSHGKGDRLMRRGFGVQVAPRLAQLAEIVGRQRPRLAGWFETFGSAGFFWVGLYCRHGYEPARPRSYRGRLFSTASSGCIVT